MISPARKSLSTASVNPTACETPPTLPAAPTTPVALFASIPDADGALFVALPVLLAAGVRAGDLLGFPWTRFALPFLDLGVGDCCPTPGDGDEISRGT